MYYVTLISIYYVTCIVNCFYIGFLNCSLFVNLEFDAKSMFSRNLFWLQKIPIRLLLCNPATDTKKSCNNQKTQQK